MNRAPSLPRSYSTVHFFRAALVLVVLLLSPSAISVHPSPDSMQGGLGVFVRGSRTMTPGTAAALRIATHLAPSETVTNPVGNVAVTVTLSGGGKQLLLSQGRTDGSGGLDARLAAGEKRKRRRIPHQQGG